MKESNCVSDGAVRGNLGLGGGVDPNPALYVLLGEVN